MNLSKQILNFLRDLQTPDRIPDGVEILNPYRQPSSWKIVEQFYTTYYENDNKRMIVFGINPGRYGGGVTGIPFTDPVNLEQICGISNDLEKRTELSSRFIYEVIDAYGGPKDFYETFYISSISPLGYIKDGKNLNYYDIESWKEIFQTYAADMIRYQYDFIRKDRAICIGQGENAKFLKLINDENRFFDQIINLPHPRWITQYRLKQKEKYIQEYLDSLTG